MAEETKRREMRDLVSGTLDITLDELSLDKAAAFLLEKKCDLQIIYGSKYTKYILVRKSAQYDEGYSFNIQGIRDESDEELAERLVSLSIQNNNKKSKELRRQNYLALKKEFEGE